MNLAEQMIIMRRFLRDPEGDVWSADQLLLYWNSAQIEVAAKLGYMERAMTLRYPSQFVLSYLHEWEYQYTGGSLTPVDKIGLESGDYVMSFPWEAAYDATTTDAVDDGARLTQQWEASYSNPSEVLRVHLSDDIESVKYAAFDEDTIEQTNERTISSGDGYYKTTTGEAEYYYFPDKMHNCVVVYPRPVIALDDSVTITHSGIIAHHKSLMTGNAYLHDWENDNAYPGSNAFRLGSNYDDTKVFLFDWELSVLADTDGQEIDDTEDYKYCWGWELSYDDEIPDLDYDMADEVVTDDDADISTEDNLFLIYKYHPKPVVDVADDLTDFPEYILHIVRAATLERAYGADTDGYIPSLREYWKLRKDIGIETIKVFMRKRSVDRDYRFGSYQSTSGDRRWPKLPAGYPAL
jgi:hypothetical protein